MCRTLGGELQSREVNKQRDGHISISACMMYAAFMAAVSSYVASEVGAWRWRMALARGSKSAKRKKWQNMVKGGVAHGALDPLIHTCTSRSRSTS